MSSNSRVRRASGRPRSGSPVFDKAEFLKLALRAFAEKGFDGVSIRHLARDYGVAHQLLHHHFQSKDDIWRQAVATAVDSFVTVPKDLGEASPDKTELDRFRDASFDVIEGVRKNPEVYKIMTDELLSNSDRFAYLYKNYLGLNTGLSTSLLQAARAKKTMNDFDMLSVHLLVVLIVSSALIVPPFEKLYAEDNEGYELRSAEDYSREMVNIVMDGLRIRE